MRRARAFGREVAFSANDGARIAGVGHQADVRQLGPAIHEDDVRRFDVAMDEAVFMQVAECFGERQAEFEHARGGEAAVPLQIGAERAGRIQ